MTPERRTRAEAAAIRNGSMDPSQRKRAIVTAVVLGALAVGIYLTVILKYLVR